MHAPRSISRRRILAHLTGISLISGFDPVRRLWVGAAQAASCPEPGFTPAPLPELDGTLHTDPATLEASASDVGNIVTRVPWAVLRPGSVADIQAMIRFCRRHDITVAGRGQGHTTHGQSLNCGLVIEVSALDQIHSIDATGADVDAGVLWRNLLLAAFEQGLRPAALTGYTQLSVGGTLSVGGLSASYGAGLQVDRVQALQVVTGRGDVHVCSPAENRDLFEVVLGGLGQCGIITRARVDLVPADPLATTYRLRYVDNATFFDDLRILLNRGEFNDIFAQWFPQETAGFVYELNATIFHGSSNRPDQNHLLRALSQPPQAALSQEQSWVDYVLFPDVVFENFKRTLFWDDLLKPWFDVFLPGATIEQYVAEVVPKLTFRDVGPTGFVLLFPQRRSRLTRPFMRVPDSPDWIYLFDILTSSALPGPDPAFVDEMMARNRRLFDRARELGGTRYPIGSLAFDRSDWQRHYGDLWPELARRKQRFDPDNILTPGPGIFAP